MIPHFADVDDDITLPATPLDLSQRIRELRTRQGLKQSEVARRMGLDPSIPSLWEQGKRPVPSSRLRALAEALGVAVADLLEGVSGAPPVARVVAEPPPARLVVQPPTVERPLRDRAPLLSFLPPARAVDTTAVVPDDEAEEVAAMPARFVPAERPPLVGTVPAGWEPSDRVQDISPSLPDGYWLDPVKLEKASARQLLRSRLCAADRKQVGEQEVPGAALAERIWKHCSREADFASGRLPLVEAIFRGVLASAYGGLPAETLIETLRERAGAMPLTPGLLRRLGDSVRSYPMRWVDRDLFR